MGGWPFSAKSAFATALRKAIHQAREVGVGSETVQASEARVTEAAARQTELKKQRKAALQKVSSILDAT